jgi:hypothetical protein
LANQQVLVFGTRRERWSREAPLRYRLVTKIQLSHNSLPTSPEGGVIHVSLVRQFSSDLSVLPLDARSHRNNIDPEFVTITQAPTSLRLEMR